VKVWPKFEDRCGKAFVVTDGVFEPETPNLQQKIAVLSLICSVGKPTHLKTYPIHWPE
jgi:hypothetical protein